MITVGLIPRSALAIEKAGRIVGSEKILAEKVNIRRQKLNYWKLYTLLPCEKAIEIFNVTQGEVSINDLRSDLIPIVKKFAVLYIEKELPINERLSLCNSILNVHSNL